jgi:hypothetical protein
MLNIECNGARQPAGYKMSDGKLWFPTQGGAAVIDPAAVSVIRNPHRSRSKIACYSEATLTVNGPSTFSPGRENLEIHYTD